MLLAISTNEGTKFYKCEEVSLGDAKEFKIIREFGDSERIKEKSFVMEIELLP